LSMAAAIEHGSTHPLAKAVIAQAAEQHVAYTPAGELRDLPGLGLQAETGGQRIYLGNQRWMLQLGIPAADMEKQLQTIDADGRTISWLASEEDGQLRLAGVLAFGDEIKPSARLAIERLHALKLSTALLTGDN